MADVSQVIQMQRLRASAARRPVKNDKSITHLYQHQVTSSGIAEFLPNPKTKNTDARTIDEYYYVPGKQAKPKVLPRNVFGITPVPIPTPLPFIGALDYLDLGNFVFTGLPGSTFVGSTQSYSVNVDTHYIQFINVDPSISNASFVSIQAALPDKMGSLDIVTLVNPNSTPVTSFGLGGAPNFITELTFGLSPGIITNSTIMIVKNVNVPLADLLVIRIL